MDYKETVKCMVDTISTFVENHHILNFYVGKTENFEKRESQQKEEKGYDYVWKIAHGSPETINQAEKDLIAKFQVNPKFDNINAGGGGNPEADTLYLAVRAKIESVDELYEDALPIDGLDDIEIPD